MRWWFYGKMSETVFSIEYIGGHPSYLRKDKGQLRISEKDVSFWSGTLKKQQKFSISLQDISKVELQEKDKITLTRAILLGPFSLIFKKHKEYLVLYFSVSGMESGAIFDFPRDVVDANKSRLMDLIEKARAHAITSPTLHELAALKISAEPMELPADGRSTSIITIELLNSEGKPIQAPEDTEVALFATKGSITSPVKLREGEVSKIATLTSSLEMGTVSISAESNGMKRASMSLGFVEKRRYCMRCGTRMSVASNICPKCGKMPPSGVDTKACRNCGEVMPRVARFCNECGANQPIEERKSS